MLLAIPVLAAVVIGFSGGLGSLSSGISSLASGPTLDGDAAAGGAPPIQNLTGAVAPAADADVAGAAAAGGGSAPSAGGTEPTIGGATSSPGVTTAPPAACPWARPGSPVMPAAAPPPHRPPPARRARLPIQATW
jgi:hypothetical protein